jgi:biotin transporter BioY
MTIPLKSIWMEYIQLHPMSPMKITIKPLVTTSSGLLVGHSKNTIAMDLIVILIYLFIPLLPTSGMGHMFFWPSAWNEFIVE